MIFTVIIGIAVDDTIRILSRYQEEQQGQSRRASGYRATRASMQAILMTTVILVCGFVVLTALTFPRTAHLDWSEAVCGNGPHCRPDFSARSLAHILS